MRILFALALTGLFVLRAVAQPVVDDHGGHHPDPDTLEKLGQLVNAEVPELNPKAREILLRHDTIPGLAMPPMTMSFQVLDASVPETLKPGDKVRFTADRLGGVLTVLRLEIAK